MAQLLDFSWKDSKGLTKLQMAAYIAMAIALAAISINVPQFKATADLYTTLFVLGALFSFIDLVFENNEVFESTGLGATPGNAVRGAIIGGIFAFAINAGAGLRMVTPYSILAVGGAASISPGNAFFIVLTAAIVENLLFVNTLAPTLGKWIGNNLVAAVIVSATAAVFHYAAYGADPASMLAAFVFFFAMIVLNSYTKTTGTGFMAHAVNNASVILRMGV